MPLPPGRHPTSWLLGYNSDHWFRAMEGNGTQTVVGCGCVTMIQFFGSSFRGASGAMCRSRFQMSSCSPAHQRASRATQPVLLWSRKCLQSSGACLPTVTLLNRNRTRGLNTELPPLGFNRITQFRQRFCSDRFLIEQFVLGDSICLEVPDQRGEW